MTETIDDEADLDDDGFNEDAHFVLEVQSVDKYKSQKTQMTIDSVTGNVTSRSAKSLRQRRRQQADLLIHKTLKYIIMHTITKMAII